MLLLLLLLHLRQNELTGLILLQLCLWQSYVVTAVNSGVGLWV